MQDEISFIEFDSYVKKDKYEQAAQIAFDIFYEDLQITRSNIIYKIVSIDQFFDKYEELPKPWLGNPYATIEGLKNGRTKEDRGRLLFFWLFLNHPDKCEPLAQHLWDCSSFAEHHKNELLKRKIASRADSNSTDLSVTNATDDRLMTDVGTIPLITQPPIGDLTFGQEKQSPLKHQANYHDKVVGGFIESPAAFEQSRRITTGSEPENFVDELCKMGAIQVETVPGSQTKKVLLSLTFSYTSKSFGDLFARCGFNRAKVSTQILGLKVKKHHHVEEPLKDRLAQLIDDEFLVKQTRSGPPDPFLLGSVFENTALVSVEREGDVQSPGVLVSCSVELPDLEVEAYTSDGEKFPDLSKEQRQLRKSALEHFIRQRCADVGFEGIVAQAHWSADE